MAPEDRKRVSGSEPMTYLELEDFRFAEEILRNGREQFLLYDGETGRVSYADQLVLGHRTFVPRPVSHAERTGLTLPSDIGEYGSLHELIAEMESFALQEFDPGDAEPVFRIIIRTFLSTWLHELQERNAERFMPIVNPRGPSQTGKKRLLTVARYLCRHPLYQSGADRIPSMFRACSPWEGTLVIDEGDLRNSDAAAEAARFFNSRADGVPLPRVGEDGAVKWFYSFGMTVIATRRPFKDDGLSTRCLVYPSSSTDRPGDYNLVPPPSWVAWGNRLQNKLLLFRLRMLAKLHTGQLTMPTQLDIPGVSSFRVRETMLALFAFSQEEPSIKEDIYNIGKQLERQQVEDAAQSPEGQIMNRFYEWLDDGDLTMPVRYDSGWRVDWKSETKQNKDGTKEETWEPMNAMKLKEILGWLEGGPRPIIDYWRGMGQRVTQQRIVNGKRVRGILIVKDPARLDREFRKLVPDARPKADLFRGPKSIDEMFDELEA